MVSKPTHRLGRELGRGALGRVVEVEGPGGERLAGKILHDSHRADDKALARFAGEAEITRDLDHPNIAKVHGIHSIEGHDVLLMELVDGHSLARLIAAEAPLPRARLLSLGAALADGLAAAHHAGLIHRDLKPDNILLDEEGRPKIVDFGMARATSFAGVDASAFAVVGTPDYMAPESVDPLALDARSDLYALGCILYEMTTGTPPYLGSTAFAVIEAHRQQPIPELEVTVERPAALIAVIRALLSKSPADRPQSAAAVKRELESIRDSGGALVVAGASVVASAGACASCGAPSIAEIDVCFGCGLKQVQLERGRHTVFVTGPGETTDKLDSDLRAKLVEWIESNPSLGITVGALAKTVPRLPFVIATKVSEPSATSLVASLESLGLECEARRGGRFALKAVRKKGWKLGGRIALIGVSSLAYGLQNAVGAALVPFLGLGALLAVGGGFLTAGRHAAKQGAPRRSSLPKQIAEPMARVADVVPSIGELRHRESLRAVIQRVLGLRAHVPSDEREALDRDLGSLLDLALVGAARVDQIDSQLAACDMRNPSQDERRLMRERDSWSARLLEITAFLDSLRARYAALHAGVVASEPSLADLRAHIEALEEIESL